MKVHVNLYDKNKSLSGTAQTYVDDEVVKPGIPTTFKITIGDNDVATSIYDIKSLKMEITGDNPDAISLTPAQRSWLFGSSPQS